MQNIHGNLEVYKVLIEEIPTPVCLYSVPDFRMVIANKAILNIWNKDHSVIGKTLTEVFPNYHSYNFESILEDVLKSGEKSVFNEFPISFASKEGIDIAYFFNLTYTPIKDPEGKVWGIMKTFVDVTEQVEKRFQLKEAQEFNKRTLNDSEIGTFDIDIVNNKIWLDNVAKKLTGYENEPIEQLELNVNLEKFIHPDDLEVLRNQFLQAIDPNKKELYSTKYRTVNKEGKVTYWVHSIGRAYFNKENKPIRLSGIIKNLTDQVRVFNKKRQMISLIENSLQYMAISDLNGKFVYMNKYGREFVGLQLEEDITKFHIKEFFTPYHYQESQEQITPHLKESGKWSGTIYLQHLKTKEVIPCLANFVVIKNEQTGEPVARGVTIKDLRSELQQIKQLAESEDRFRRIIHQSPMAIMILRGDDFILDMANPKMLEYIKRDHSSLSKSIFKVLPEINQQQFHQLLDLVYRQGKPYFGYGEKALIMSEGVENELYFNYVFSPLTNADDKVNGVVVVANEVSSQVKIKQQLESSEKHFRSLILDAPYATAIYRGRELTIDVANDAMLGLWGKDRSVIGSKLSKAVPELEGQPFLGLLDEVYTSGIPYHTERQQAELIIEGKLKTFWFNFTYKPLFNEKKEVYAILHMAIDITSQINIEKQKDDFIGIASHELKTPVTTIKAYAQLLESMLRTAGDNTKADLMLKLEKQINRLNELISELLDVTKMHSGKIEFNYSQFDFEELVNEVVEELQPTSHKNNIVPNLGMVGLIKSDRSRIRQVLTNLISNALKYSPEPTDIIVKTEQTKNDTLILSVQDFGIGINTQKQNKVFEQFYRTNDNKLYTFPGLGLGLYISSEIIKKEEGRIWLESEEGKGSTFYFEIPLNREN